MAEAWWKKPPEELTREELIGRLQTITSVNGILKRELNTLIAENAALIDALKDGAVAA